jgi:hypothetical protein
MIILISGKKGEKWIFWIIHNVMNSHSQRRSDKWKPDSR